MARQQMPHSSPAATQPPPPPTNGAAGASDADDDRAKRRSEEAAKEPPVCPPDDAGTSQEASRGNNVTASVSIAPASSEPPEELPSWAPPVWLGNLMLDGAAGGGGGGASSLGSLGGGGGIGGSTTGASALSHAGITTNSKSASASLTLPKTWAAPHPHYYRLPHTFSVPVPAVPSAVLSELRRHLHAGELRILRQLRTRLLGHRTRAAELQAKVAQLEELQERALRRAHEAARQELRETCNRIEGQHRASYEADKERRRAAWRQQLEDECRRELEEGGGESGDVPPSSPRPGSEAPEGDDGQQQPVPPSAALLQAREKEREASSLLAEKQLELDKAQQHLDQLQEKRSEIVWLLKQVIKAEEKLKAKSNRKPAAKQFTSKGA